MKKVIVMSVLLLVIAGCGSGYDGPCYYLGIYMPQHCKFFPEDCKYYPEYYSQDYPETQKQSEPSPDINEAATGYYWRPITNEDIMDELMWQEDMRIIEWEERLRMEQFKRDSDKIFFPDGNPFDKPFR